jgi:hypothetical protein
MRIGTVTGDEPFDRGRVVMRIARAAIILFVMLDSVRPSASGDTLNEGTAHDCAVAALQCSEVALRRYALSSSETAEKVADVAFEKCSDEWGRYAEFSGKSMDNSAALMEAQANCEKKMGPDCPTKLPGSIYTLQAAKRAFLATAVTEVFDIRAEAKRN